VSNYEFTYNQNVNLMAFPIDPPETTTTAMVPTTPSILHPCRFEDPEKGVIDLTTLGRTDGNPAYTDRTPQQSSNYSMLFLLFCV
jgi:hypothetical protein